MNHRTSGLKTPWKWTKIISVLFVIPGLVLFFISFLGFALKLPRHKFLGHSSCTRMSTFTFLCVNCSCTLKIESFLYFPVEQSEKSQIPNASKMGSLVLFESESPSCCLMLLLIFPLPEKIREIEGRMLILFQKWSQWQLNFCWRNWSMDCVCFSHVSVKFSFLSTVVCKSMHLILGLNCTFSCCMVLLFCYIP